MLPDTTEELFRGGRGEENLLIAYILFSWYGERTVACITIIFSKVWDINTV